MDIPKISELIEQVKKNNKKGITTFESLLEEYPYWYRHLSLNAIDADVADVINSMICFWNAMDDEDDIPVGDRKPIYIIIDSPGGDVQATLTIIDAIKLSHTPVITVNIGAAYSGGFFVFINGDRRIAYPHSTFLYHEGCTEMGGDANKFQNWSDFYKKILLRLKETTLSNTKITPELYEEKRRDDWWIEAEEAVSLGIADEICHKLIY